MKVESLETVEHIYDTNLVKEAIYYIEQGYYARSNESQDVVSRIANTANQVISTLKKQSITIDTKVTESEEVAREYFGNDFIAQFEEIRKKLAEQNATLYIHGTDMEIANKTMQTGFEAKHPSISSTAIYQASYKDMPEYNGFSTMLNWPHREYKGLVLIAVPNECLSIQEEAKPIWERRSAPNGEANNSLLREYAIKPEYIVGIIDVVGKQITSNPNYTREHFYDGLVLDDSVSSIIMQKNAKQKSSVHDEEQLDNANKDSSSYTEPESEVAGLVEEIYTFYNWILSLEETKTSIVEARGNILPNFTYVDGTQKPDQISEMISRLMQLVPSLKSIETDDKEIDDFISDVRTSDINKITDKIRRYQRNIEKQQEVDWNEEENYDGVELDDWD